MDEAEQIARVIRLTSRVDHQTEKLFEQQLCAAHDTTLGVYYGPVPHGATALFGYLPCVYQVVWQSPPGMPRPDVPESYLFRGETCSINGRMRQVLIWLPGDPLSASTLVKMISGLEIQLRGMQN